MLLILVFSYPLFICCSFSFCFFFLLFSSLFSSISFSFYPSLWTCLRPYLPACRKLHYFIIVNTMTILKHLRPAPFDFINRQSHKTHGKPVLFKIIDRVELEEKPYRQHTWNRNPPCLGEIVPQSQLYCMVSKYAHMHVH